MVTSRQPSTAELDALWRRGRHHEAVGDLASARREYEKLLELNADHIPARLRLSRFEQIHGRYLQARAHALAAADSARTHRNNRLLGYITMRLLDFAEEGEVGSLILSASWDDPDVRRQAPTLAQHLLLCARYADCIRFIDVMSAQGANAELAYVHGEAMRASGHLQEARADFETAIALSPGFADAYWSLSKTGGGDPGKRIDRLRAVLSSLVGEGDRAHACYALFHELDRAGQHDAAWAMLEQGASIMQRANHYDPERVAASLKREMEYPWLENWLPQPVNVQPAPIFVVGLPRTGTTLLDRIVGHHGWVSPVGERNDFAAAVSEATDSFFSSLAEGGEKARLHGLEWEGVGRAYMSRLKRHASATAYALDKNPANLFSLPLILRALPHAKILCMQRDPMDAAFSNLKELFQGGAYPYSYRFEDLAHHVSLAGRWMRHWSRLAPMSVLSVDYERLVENPETETARVIEFCGLPAREGLHEIVRNNAPVATASSVQVREPINTRGIGAWHRYAAQLEPLRRMLEASV